MATMIQMEMLRLRASRVHSVPRWSLASRAQAGAGTGEGEGGPEQPRAAGWGWPLALLLALGPACTPDTDTTDSALKVSDRDGDGILDVHEGSSDNDGDGLANFLDSDSDGDLLPDVIEAGDLELLTFPRDADSDGIPDFLDSDSDNNGMPDRTEAGLNPLEPLDFDEDLLPDYADPDNDGDLISDLIELGGQVPLDSDSDGTPDYTDLDSDGDFILDRDESGITRVGQQPRDTDGDGRPDYRTLDSDADGLSDREEAGDADLMTAPRDTDRDGIPDFIDLDSDGDALTDAVEPSQSTQIILYDTDADGASDGLEILAGSNPNDARSLPAIRWLEVPQRAQARLEVSFSLYISSVDVVFVLDNTGSMSDDIASLTADLGRVVDQVTDLVPDAAFSAATYQNYGSISGSQKPHVMVQQLTLDRQAVQAALAGLDATGGSGAGLESLYQALTGLGFDQDCSQTYDARMDVPPFIARPEDVFQGRAAGVYDASDPSTGTLGGMGFRAGALPVLVYAADIPANDPDLGAFAPAACEAPGTSHPAGSSDVVAAARAVGARIIGVNVGGSQSVQSHLEDLCWRTDSLYDAQGDGVVDDPLVFSTAEGSIADAVSQGIRAALVEGSFGEVVLRAGADPRGFFSGASPEARVNVSSGDRVDFEVFLFGAVPARPDDQLFQITLEVVGDESTRLATIPLILIVPGERA